MQLLWLCKGNIKRPSLVESNGHKKDQAAVWPCTCYDVGLNVVCRCIVLAMHFGLWCSLEMNHHKVLDYNLCKDLPAGVGALNVSPPPSVTSPSCDVCCMCDS